MRTQRRIGGESQSFRLAARWWYRDCFSGLITYIAAPLHRSSL
jgi:hypothetical protein